MKRNLQLSEELVLRLSRMKSPIAEALLNLKYAPEGKNYINQLGVSVDNPSYISYNDRNKESKNGKKIKHSCRYTPELTTIRLHPRMFHKYFHRGKIKTNKNIIGFLPISFHYMYPVATPQLLKRNFPFIPYRTGHEYNCPQEVLGLEKTNMEVWEKNESSNLAYLGCILQRYEEFRVKWAPINFNLVKVKRETKIWYTDNLWKPEHRLHASAAKIIRRVLSDVWIWSDTELEEFSSEYKGKALMETTNPYYVYEEFKGEDIKWVYHFKNYYGGDEEGTIGSSCMRYSDCQDYFNVYTENPEKCGIGTLLRDGKVAARALLWFPQGRTSNIKWHDRIYAYDHETELLLKGMLEKHGYENIYDDGICREIYLDIDTSDYFPYMDTFRYARTDGKFSSDSCSDYDAELDETDGSGFDDDNSVLCEDCGGVIEEGDGHYIDGSAYCDSCTVYDDYNNESIRISDAVGVRTGAWTTIYMSKDDAILSYNGVWLHPDYTIRLADGRIAGEFNDEVEIDYKGDSYLAYEIEETHILFNDEWYPMEMVGEDEEGELYLID